MRAALRAAYRAFLEELQLHLQQEACFALFDLLRSHQTREAERARFDFITPAVQAPNASAATRGLALGWLKGVEG